MVDLSGVPRPDEVHFQCHPQLVEVLVFSFCSQAEISAFAENSASAD
jgi:hypothetical protein